MSYASPKKKNWRKGSTQVYLFIRDDNGQTNEICADVCSTVEAFAAYELFKKLAGGPVPKDGPGSILRG